MLHKDKLSAVNYQFTMRYSSGRSECDSCICQSKISNLHQLVGTDVGRQVRLEATIVCKTCCIPVSMQFRAVFVAEFQKRMHLSAVPPPEASSPCWWGDHAMAFTAALWSLNLMTGEVEFRFQMYSWLSLPPLAISRSSGDHFRPHTCTKTTHE